MQHTLDYFQSKGRRKHPTSSFSVGHFFPPTLRRDLKNSLPLRVNQNTRQSFPTNVSFVFKTVNFAVLPRFQSNAYSRGDEITELYDRFKYASIVSDQRVFLFSLDFSPSTINFHLRTSREPLHLQPPNLAHRCSLT